MSDEWCDLIKRWSVNVGVSIDGPAEFHNVYRKRRDGSGSFEEAYAGLKTLQKSGIPFHVISVLTTESMPFPEKLLEFYVANSISTVCFNIEEQEGANVVSKFVNARADGDYRRFLKRFIELSLSIDNPPVIREVETALEAIQAYNHMIYNEQTKPFRIISVDCDGNLSTFSPELLGAQHSRYESFRFGNLLTDDFDTIASRIDKSRLYADILAGEKECAAKCDYFGVCGGGAPASKIFENGSAATTETVQCRTFKHSIDVVLDLVDRLPKTQKSFQP